MGVRNFGRGPVGSSFEVFEKYLVPLIFEPFAGDLAARVAARQMARVLEIAAGTGVVTRAMAAVLPPDVMVVATDISPELLERAVTVPVNREVDWREADAMSLPFEDGSFDAIVCQFGVMHFEDRAKAYAEAYRVLRPGGRLLFNSWDRIEENEFAAKVMEALGRLFPHDPPRFMERVPHAYNSESVIQGDLRAAGFLKPAQLETITAWSRTDSHEVPAIGFCQGTGFRNEIETRGMELGEATEFAAEAIAERFGRRNLVGRIQAVVVEVEK